ncbi:MAG TPA: hypothetical protein VFU98_19255 [Microlunatus sp.]|nr:hypothetical protein [Microlunatus sp.]
MRRLRTRDPVPWLVGLFAANVLLQRISVPNLSIPIIVPISVIWVGLVLYAGVAVLNFRRLLLWLLGAGISAGLVIAQVLLVEGPFVSVNSWALWMTVWLPLIVHFVDRRWETYLKALRGVANVGLGLAALSLVFTGVQYLGVPYKDWVAQVVPSSLLVSGYVVSYPVTYGSEIYKSNAWIGLEPSFVSFMLGVCVVAAVVARLHWAKVSVLLLAMLTTTAGSGLAIVITFVAVTIISGRGRSLFRYALPAVALAVLFTFTLLGEAILSRVTEAGQSRSSTSLRMIEPYLFLWPHWLADPMGVLLGYGPGSSAWVVANAGILGLLVPSVAKVLFDYGLIGGLILIALMVSTFVRAPEPRFALAMAISMFTVQAASPGLVICAVCVAALWSPAARGRPHAASPARRAPRVVDSGPVPERTAIPTRSPVPPPRAERPRVGVAARSRAARWREAPQP